MLLSRGRVTHLPMTSNMSCNWRTHNTLYINYFKSYKLSLHVKTNTKFSVRASKEETRTLRVQFVTMVTEQGPPCSLADHKIRLKIKRLIKNSIKV